MTSIIRENVQICLNKKEEIEKSKNAKKGLTGWIKGFGGSQVKEEERNKIAADIGKLKKGIKDVITEEIDFAKREAEEEKIMEALNNGLVTPIEWKATIAIEELNVVIKKEMKNGKFVKGKFMLDTVGIVLSNNGTDPRAVQSAVFVINDLKLQYISKKDVAIDVISKATDKPLLKID